jgi:hypothetical protein
MKIEEQVTSLELSKKLKELGVKEESLWYWWKAGHIFVEEERYAGKQWEKLASAFTVAELGEMLPKGFNQYEDTFYKTRTWKFRTSARGLNIEGNTEADARAKMLIYLLENRLMEKPKRSPKKLAA